MVVDTWQHLNLEFCQRCLSGVRSRIGPCGYAVCPRCGFVEWKWYPYDTPSSNDVFMWVFPHFPGGGYFPVLPKEITGYYVLNDARTYRDPGYVWVPGKTVAEIEKLWRNIPSVRNSNEVHE